MKWYRRADEGPSVNASSPAWAIARRSESVVPLNAVAQMTPLLRMTTARKPKLRAREAPQPATVVSQTGETAAVLLQQAALVACTCGFLALTAPQPMPGTDLATLLSSNPELYNLSLGHLFDLTSEAMGLFRGPLIVVAVGMVVLGPVTSSMSMPMPLSVMRTYRL